MVPVCLPSAKAVTPVANATLPTTRLKPPATAPATLVKREPSPKSTFKLGEKLTEGFS